MSYNKTIPQIIKSIAHELAHVLLCSDDHSNTFRKEWVRLNDLITEEYNK